MAQRMHYTSSAGSLHPKMHASGWLPGSGGRAGSSGTGDSSNERPSLSRGHSNSLVEQKERGARLFAMPFEVNTWKLPVKNTFIDFKHDEDELLPDRPDFRKSSSAPLDDKEGKNVSEVPLLNYVGRMVSNVSNVSLPSMPKMVTGMRKTSSVTSLSRPERVRQDMPSAPTNAVYEEQSSSHPKLRHSGTTSLTMSSASSRESSLHRLQAAAQGRAVVQDLRGEITEHPFATGQLLSELPAIHLRKQRSRDSQDPLSPSSVTYHKQRSRELQESTSPIFGQRSWEWQEQFKQRTRDWQEVSSPPPLQFKQRSREWEEQPLSPGVPSWSLREASAPEAVPNLDAALGFASIGSIGHDEGDCRPCAYHWKPNGCSNGKNCTFCHMCNKGELKKRKKEKIMKLRTDAMALLTGSDTNADHLQSGLVSQGYDGSSRQW
eukprot:gnl/TRDRNA2_/TRDRNA2_92516_c0_seq1.p1 gnl/TRDRNA2_/TRDRNA2_92516_c0~~gnl/TRDRNA2_/TRDRNA2_92516_c0_seq1.p1  ORF type:complete len:434 (+),score=66.77 gnl/TRDRNA2_/TRDRNA2_92516_c0_seq1:78-1379(+)